MTDWERRIQSCVDHINTAVDVDPWAKELVAEMGKEILKAQLSKEDATSDCISRQGAIDHFKSITVATSIGNKYNEGFVDGLYFAVGHLKTMPSAQPYTDEEIQKIQELEQAQLDKAFELGKESVKAEIIHCGDCKHWREGTAFSYCDKLHGMGVLDALDYMTAEDDYCSMAERRTAKDSERAGVCLLKETQPEHKTGQWLPTICNSDGMHHEWCGFHCSICKKATMLRHNFCPRCGAKMERGKQE